MTVRELIQALAAFDPDLPVVMPSRVHDDFSEFFQLFADAMSTSKRHPGLELCDYEDEGCQTVVRLFEEGDFDDRHDRPKPVTN